MIWVMSIYYICLSLNVEKCFTSWLCILYTLDMCIGSALCWMTSGHFWSSLLLWQLTVSPLVLVTIGSVIVDMVCSTSHWSWLFAQLKSLRSLSLIVWSLDFICFYYIKFDLHRCFLLIKTNYCVTRVTNVHWMVLHLSQHGLKSC